MNIATEIKKTWTEVPEEVQRLKRALIIFIVWKLAYGFILFPIRIPDKQFTDLTANSTAWVLQKFFYPQNNFVVKEISSYALDNKKDLQYSDWILMNNKKVIGIASPCNGLELYVLYVAFLLCFPTSFKSILIYTLLGIAVIYVTNIIRCAGIALMNIKNNLLTDVAHHYIFKLIMYGIIFLFWRSYTKKYLTFAKATDK